jgi:hypothetical protein
MQFRVMTDDGPRRVKFVFGKSADLAKVSRWRAPAMADIDARVRDALEFRKLAGKRWRYYFRGNEAATSIGQLKDMIRREPSREAGFILIARAPWSRATPVLGCAFCRRSWCHHLIVDFVVVHPRIVASVGSVIRGVGAGMIYGIVNLADDLGVRVVWGEATVNSARFYEKVLQLTGVTDHFFIEGETFAHCLREQAKGNR